MFNSNNYLKFIVKDEKDVKLKQFLREKGISSRLLYKSIKNQKIYLNNIRSLKNEVLKKGDIIYLEIPKEDLNAYPQYKDLDILYENEDIIIVNKNADMTTHTGKDDVKDTLLNYMAGYFLKNNIERKVRFINRLDRDTSGIVIVAKNAFSHFQISKQFENDIVEKKYIAVVEGILKEKEDIIEKPIIMSEDGIRRIISEDGKYAKTGYKVLEEIDNKSLVEIKLYTGRTHQIRVHMSSIGHPIIGDELYGSKSSLIKRQALHCKYMSFYLPRENEKIEIVANLPTDVLKLLNYFY